MSRVKTGCDVKSCFMCKGCIKDWLPLIEINKRNLHLKKGEQIFTEGQPVQGIYFLYKGRVKVHKQWGNEKELIIRFAGEGDVLGHRGAFGDNSFYPVSATALEPVVVCFVETDFFLSTLKMNPELTFKLTMLFARELQVTEQRMHGLIHMDMKGRLADSLLLIQKQFGTDEEGNINLVLTRQDLASFAGTSYETVFRILVELTADKIIAVKEKNIKILDEQKLKPYTTAAS